MTRPLAAAAFLAALAAAPANAAVITAATTVVYGAAPQITLTSTGPIEVTLAPGASFHVSGTWSVIHPWDACHSCLVQGYVAGQPGYGGQINLFNHVLTDTALTGTYDGDFLAPATIGTYYIGASLHVELDYLVGVTGAVNQALQANYLLHVAAVETPEPTSLALLGTGLLALAARRRQT